MLPSRDIRDILSYSLSVLLYPLFVSTYVMVFFCYTYSHHMKPLGAQYQMLAIGGTLLFTCILPFTILWMLIQRKKVTNLDVTNRSERTLPYLYALACIGAWCYFLHTILMPNYMVWSAVASLLVLIIVALITQRWKISAHLSSMGGATAMVMGILMHCGLFRPSIIVIMLLLSWLLMLARIRLEAHTPTQTVAGYLLGFIVVLIPNIIIAYAS